MESNGLTSSNYHISKYRDMVHVNMPAKIANTLFKTEFALFRSSIQRDVALPRITKPYFLPQEIADVISVVDDIMRFPSIRQSPRSFGAELTSTGDNEFNSCGTKCNGYTTPAVLQAAYSFDAVKTVASGNSMSVAEFQLQYCKLYTTLKYTKI